MSTSRRVPVITTALILAVVSTPPPTHAADIGTAFTYQGFLES